MTHGDMHRMYHQVWTYIDPTNKLNSSAYQNWGMGSPSDQSFGPEPNNALGDEKCGGANFTQTREDAAGWADAQCSRQYIFMCRLLRESRSWCWLWHDSCYWCVCCKLACKMACLL